MAAPHLDVLTRVEDMRGEDEQETAALQALAAEARTYLLGSEWCEGTTQEFLGLGIGGVVGVFCFEIVPAAPEVDEWLWVVVGDLPPAYLVTDNAPTALEALRVYCGLMLDWVDAVRAGADLAAVFPVDVAATEEHAALLEQRVQFIVDEVIPAFEA
ncbi:MAG: hypothetical protein ACYTGN_03950 [Planctomycetota bacterium]